jgi:hypothetical protein
LFALEKEKRRFYAAFVEKLVNKFVN